MSDDDYGEHFIVMEGRPRDVFAVLDGVVAGGALSGVHAYSLTDQAQARRALKACRGHCSSHGLFDTRLYRRCPDCYADEHPDDPGSH